MKTAIIGWGSLLWDDRPQFDQHHGAWYFDGPLLQLEFSRISISRQRALTLVLEEEHGAQCRVAYTISKRETPALAIQDLQIRENATLAEVGVYQPHAIANDPSLPSIPPAIVEWADQTDFDAVIWTALPNNFRDLNERGENFSPASAIAHIESLCEVGKWKAVEYVHRAPEFIRTPLRSELESLDWFAQMWKDSQDLPKL
ncbi:hypothetical protein C5Y96_11625 [Blastopirellula marina]|uniref:Uncharacterized protein n=1 Tax=Blastopirellula marina TaxID=124 RepID=A0A2S8FMT9_9BACT|nr:MULTISPECIES: hypothetical protein [Pirellulaceae]PQO33481.1 hypothetical protein C5Y96_11625 [Blastopirellula marina]RCS52572.1 hypothetical protein DTL36_11635 [Bremerella cremea]